MSTPEQETRGTEYLVLERAGTVAGESGAEKRWTERETRFARSAKDAISGYVRENGEQGGEFVAVPTRSWSHITVATETQTRLTFQ